MRAWMTGMIAVGVALGAAQPAVHACGDKFLVVGRGARFHRAYAALYPASIVIYVHPQGNTFGAVVDPKFHADLTMAGHRVLVAEDERAFTRALEAGRVDLVLASVTDVERIAQQAAGSPSKPAVLPVMYQPPSREEARAIAERYQCKLKSTDRADRYLIAIDEAMRLRAAQQKQRKAS